MPRRIDAVGPSASHYRMTFDWLGNTIWLLRKSEALTPEGTFIQTRTRNVVVNGKPLAAPLSIDDQRTDEAKQVLVTMLDHNGPWLDGGATGAGWRPPFQTLSYSFRTLREGVRENAVLDRGGEAVFEVVQDPQGKMKNQFGDRQIALNTRQYALSKNGSQFAWIHDRSHRERNGPFDLDLKRYGRIGCRLDLPLFHYRELLDSAVVTINDGKWDGRRCQVATVTMPASGTRLGFGTMFAFTSWSYIHDIVPSKEVLFIDNDRRVPLHETLTSSREKEPFEIDFADYVEIEPGQWRRCRSASNGRTTSLASTRSRSLAASTGCSGRWSPGSSPRTRAAE